jgi:pyruvate, orthophosphate dikinase
MSESYGIPVGELKKKLPRCSSAWRICTSSIPCSASRLPAGHHLSEITEMQARAIFEAAVQVAKKGIKVIPEVMIPLVGRRRNWRMQKEIVDRVAKEVLEKAGMPDLKYLVGTMIEIPRAR